MGCGSGVPVYRLRAIEARVEDVPPLFAQSRIVLGVGTFVQGWWWAVIVAPISGVISRAEIVAGQMVEPRDVLLEVIDPGRVLVEATTADASTDLNGDGVPDLTTRLTPAPACKQARTIKVSELSIAGPNSEDVGCLQAQQQGTVARSAEVAQQADVLEVQRVIAQRTLARTRRLYAARAATARAGNWRRHCLIGWEEKVMLR